MTTDQPETMPNMDDIRATTEAALGPKPGSPEAIAEREAAQTMEGFEPDDEELTTEDAAEAFPEPEPDEALETVSREFAALSHGPAPTAEDNVIRTAAFMDTADVEQGSYLPPDVPDGHLSAPHADVFANATWMIAEEQFAVIVREVMDFDEFAHLQEFDHLTIWHRQGKPKHPWENLDGEREPMLARVDIIPERDRWLVAERENPDALPELVVCLFYQHFEALREEGFFYHRDQIAMNVHIALSKISVESGILGTQAPAVVVQSPETIKRWGLFSEGLRRLQKPMLPLMQGDILQAPGLDPDQPDA